MVIGIHGEERRGTTSRAKQSNYWRAVTFTAQLTGRKRVRARLVNWTASGCCTTADRCRWELCVIIASELAVTCCFLFIPAGIAFGKRDFPDLHVMECNSAYLPLFSRKDPKLPKEMNCKTFTHHQDIHEYLHNKFS